MMKKKFILKFDQICDGFLDGKVLNTERQPTQRRYAQNGQTIANTTWLELEFIFLVGPFHMRFEISYFNPILSSKCVRRLHLHFVVF